MHESILLVDDEEPILESIGTLLRKEGYEVSCAKSADEALDIMNRKAVDLVITDLSMPGMNGMEMVERMASLEPKPKIMMITGYGSLETAMMAQRRGVCDYLIKPVRIKDLKESIRAALAGSSESQKTEAHLDSKLTDLLEYFTLVSDFTATLNASLDVREILGSTLDRLKKIGESEHASLFLFPDVIRKMYYLKGMDDASTLAAGEGISTMLAQKGKGIVDSCALSLFGAPGEEAGDDDRYRHVYDAMRQQGLGQVFLMPLMVKDAIIGLADVGCAGRERFTEVDIQIFRTLANQASLALAKAFSYLEVEERSKEIALLHNLSLKLNQSLKMSDSIKAICEGSVDITGASGALLQTSLEPGSIRNFMFNKNLGMHKEMKRSSQDWLIAAPARKTAFFSNDPVVDARVNSLEMYSLGISSLAYVPLIYEWEDMGGLTVFQKTKGRTFDQRDLHLLHLYARHASEVLLNSQLYEAVKRSREKIITEKNKMDVVFANMAEGVLTIDLERRITYINESMLQMLGVEREEVIGRHCSDVFAMERCIADCPVTTAPADLDARQSFESALTGRRGSLMSVSISFGPIRDSEGNVTGWVKVIRNMDKVKELESLKESFSRALAHDLKDPLTSLAGCLQAMGREGTPPGKQREYLTIVQDSADAMTAVIDRLMGRNHAGARSTFKPPEEQV